MSLNKDSFFRSSHKIILPLIAIFLAINTPLFAKEKIRLVLRWTPQAQFAGYYMALEKGIYRRHGLDVEILPGNANNKSLSRIISGHADFEVAFLATALERRAKGEHLVNIGQIVQDSALMLIAHQNSGINTIKDLNGARVGICGTDFQLQADALFRREQLEVTFVRHSPSFELFMRGGLDAALVMWYNEYHTLMAYGMNPHEMTTFFFKDLDLNQPEDGIYCLESTFNTSPKVVSSMIKASAEGWEYAFDHPQETVDTIIKIMKRYKIRANRAHQKWMLARMQDIILPEGGQHLNIKLKRTGFEKTVKVLIEAGVIQTGVSYDDFYKEAAK